MVEKSFREDRALDERPARQDADHASDHDATHDGRASEMWRRINTPGSAEETTVAKAGQKGAPGALPYRAELEDQLGTDLSHVKTFTDANARAASAQLGAAGYAVDGAIVLGTSTPDKNLVAHEVTHVLQQSGTGGGGAGESEAEADAYADRLTGGERVDATKLRAGGRGVRKKSLVDVFVDFGNRIDPKFTATDDELGARHAKSTVVDDTLPGRRTETTTEDKVSATGGKLAIESTTTKSTGALPKPALSDKQAAAERTKVQEAIQTARGEVATRLAGMYVQQLLAEAQVGSLERELESFGELDDVLVMTKKLQLHGQIDRAKATIAAYERDIGHCKKMMTTLDDAITDLAAEDDAWKVARDAARAELEFEKRVTFKSKKSLGLDVVKGRIEAGREEESTVALGGGREVTSGVTEKRGVEVGGGARSTFERTESLTEKDADGNTTFGEATTVGANAGLVAKPDGTVGVGGGARIARSVEDSGAKIETASKFGGAVTVNMIALPRPSERAPQQYAIIVTLDLSAGIELSSSSTKSSNTDKKLGSNTTSGKVGGSLSGQLTHTHVLDADATQQYLAALEQAGTGDKAATKLAPEFEVLYRLRHGASSADDIAGAAAAALGDADAAANMGVDESVELTLKAGAEIEGALAAHNTGKDTSAGIEGGASTEGFRTLKITRVAGKPNQQLVDVTIAFGDKDTIHGALTGSALGVTAKAGTKQWDASQLSVTFRLDATAGAEYDELYSQIVGTKTLGGLTALRSSKRFRDHVTAYTARAEEGGEDSLSLKGLIGVSSTDSFARSSEHGMDEHGETVKESGSSTDAVAFSVGPLELLRRSQTGGANFDHHGGTSMLDIYEETNSAEVGKFEVPSWFDAIAAESPAKALENALLENRKVLAGYLLDPDDVNALVRRAKDEKAWSETPIEADTGRLPTDDDYAHWADLRRALVHPKLADEYDVDHIALARQVAYGTAIADFMAKIGDGKGKRYVEAVLRGYRGGGKDLGVSYEFPPGIKPADFIELRFKVIGLERELASRVPDVDGGLKYLADVEIELAQMLNKLLHAEFQSEQSRLEMTADLRERAIAFPGLRRDFQRACMGGTYEMNLEDRIADETEDQSARVHHLEQILISSKLSEVRVLQQCENAVRDGGNDTEIADTLRPILGFRDCPLEKVLDKHVANIRQMRTAYAAAGVSESAWMCSVSIEDKSRDYDVDMDRALTALWSYIKRIPGYGVNKDEEYEKRKNEWVRRFWRY